MYLLYYFDKTNRTNLGFCILFYNINVDKSGEMFSISQCSYLMTLHVSWLYSLDYKDQLNFVCIIYCQEHRWEQIKKEKCRGGLWTFHTTWTTYNSHGLTQDPAIPIRTQTASGQLSLFHLCLQIMAAPSSFVPYFAYWEWTVKSHLFI